MDLSCSKLTFQRLALHQVEVICLLEDAVLEAPAEALQVAVVDVEHVALHPGRDLGDGEGL